MDKILISISDFYEDISKILLDSAILVLNKNKVRYEKITVPGVFHLANAINMGLENYEYIGVIVLGCIIRNKTLQSDIVASECIRAIHEISIYYSVPLGFGLLRVNNKKQALDSAHKYAKNATNACMQMMKIKEQFMICNDKEKPSFH